MADQRTYKIVMAWIQLTQKEKEKNKREKGKRGKGDAGGIRGDDREPGVASTRNDTHEKRGDRRSFKR